LAFLFLISILINENNSGGKTNNKKMLKKLSLILNTLNAMPAKEIKIIIATKDDFWFFIKPIKAFFIFRFFERAIDFIQ